MTTAMRLEVPLLIGLPLILAAAGGCSGGGTERAVGNGGSSSTGGSCGDDCAPAGAGGVLSDNYTSR
jgi:hypothetical protein